VPATVLCADDDRSLCQILARALGAEGFAVRMAHDGEEALARATAEPPDLLLLDVMLPRRDGFQVLEALRGGAGPAARLPAVLLSGCSGTPQYQERARRLGAHALLTKPVPLERLVAVIREALGPAGGEPAAAGTPPRARLAGRLEEIPFAALLHHLHGLRASGVLELRGGRKQKALELREGQPVAVRSNLVSECLGNLLVREGRISQKDVDESVRRMRAGEGLQGEILLAMDLVREEELAAALRSQAEEKLFEIFAWRSGEFRFQRGARLARANTLAVEQSPASLILSGVRTRMPLDLVDAALAARPDGVVAPGQSTFYRFQEIDVDVQEAELLAELEQAPPLAELRRRDEATRRALYALLAAELVEVRPGPPPAVRAAAGAPPPAAPAPGAPRDRAPVAEAAEAGIRTELAALAESLRGRDYFGVLGVAQDADEEAIRRAFVDAAKRTHPDRFRGASDAVKRLAEEVFGLVSRAHETVSDPRRREAYLLELRNESREASELAEGRRALQAELRFQEGERLLGRRDPAGALACFREAVELYPDEGEYHAYLGWALFLSRPDDEAAAQEALLHVRRGRKLAPTREKPYLFLGRLHHAAGRIDAAEKCLTRALQLAPGCVEAMRELRLIQMRRQKARGLIDRLLRR
jgi:CheY-like chemotaxis protein/tetratricopeptide (TPR) repeat protein